MSQADMVLSVKGTERRRGGETGGFRLEVPQFQVSRGECIALTGASGSGKSTMLDLLGLVLRPDRCERFSLRLPDGVDINVGALWKNNDRDALAAVRAVHIGYILQTGGLLPFLTAGDNIGLSRALLGMSTHDGLIDRLTATLGITRLLAKKPHDLSIGERQRVAIARALAHRPALLLADEPTAALDPGQAVDVVKLLLQLAHELNITVVIVSHDWELVQSLGLRQVRGQPLDGGTGSATRFQS